MSEINDIKIPNVVIPKFGTNEVWLNDVPFIPSNHPSVTTQIGFCLLYTSPSPRDATLSRMPSSA